MDEVLCHFLAKFHHFLTTAVFSSYKDMYRALSNAETHVEIGFTLDKVGYGKRINDCKIKLIQHFFSLHAMNTSTNHRNTSK